MLLAIPTSRSSMQAFPVLDSTDREADSFLKGTLRDVIDRESERAAEEVGAEAWTRDVSATLSPSDHGFHNALRTPSGELRFLDFEYGGFDDPAKALADAVLQPAVPIPPDLRSSFLEAAWARFDRSPELAHRLRCLYPLWAVNWCLITLNEFLPLVRERRRFAGSAEAREAQLRRSEAILANLQRDQVEGLAFLPGE